MGGSCLRRLYAPPGTKLAAILAGEVEIQKSGIFTVAIVIMEEDEMLNKRETNGYLYCNMEAAGKS